jgi:hypothetical protein
MKKVTKSTLKSFIRKNEGKLFIRVKSRFDGMVDGAIDSSDQAFSPCVSSNVHYEHNMGIQGAWLVLGSRDYFTEYTDSKFAGIEVYNSCGHFVIAIKN